MRRGPPSDVRGRPDLTALLAPAASRCRWTLCCVPGLPAGPPAAVLGRRPVVFAPPDTALRPGALCSSRAPTPHGRERWGQWPQGSYLVSQGWSEYVADALFSLLIVTAPISYFPHQGYHSFFMLMINNPDQLIYGYSFLLIHR